MKEQLLLAEFHAAGQPRRWDMRMCTPYGVRSNKAHLALLGKSILNKLNIIVFSDLALIFLRPHAISHP